MDALSFLSLVLPEDGWLVGFALKGEVKRQKPFAELSKLLHWLCEHDSQGFDVYHACASFTDRKAHKLRGHENVHAIKSLWLDTDTKESKPNAKYVDQVEAWRAVGTFCEVARLPPPLFVGSGGGLHAYWPLDAELQLDEWQALARALKRATGVHELAADPSRTADGSSILRTPGTHHWKTGRIVQCGEPVSPYPVSAFEHLKEFTSESHGGSRGLRTVQPSRIHSPIAAAGQAVYGDEPSDCGAIQRACRQIGQFAMEPGAASEPVWYAVCGLAVHAGTDGIDWLDRLQYQDQPQRDTVEWNERKRAQWQAATTGPPTCAYFESVNPGGCEGCRYQGEITSPIILGRGYGISTTRTPATPETPKSTTQVNGHTLNGEAHPEAQSKIELPDLPEPWKWSETNQLILPAEKKDGRPLSTIVSEFPIYLDLVTRTETVGQHSYTFRQYHPHHGWTAITTPAGSMFSGHAMGDLADGGASIREPKLFTKYIHDALARWHRDNVMQNRFEQCGWKDGERAFLVGTRLYQADDVQVVTATDELTTRAQYLQPTSRGSVRGWTVAANKAFTGSMPALTIILASFAAPLMRFHTRHEGGAILSAVNRASGTGKTMALEGAISVWGDPLGLQMKWIDTQAARGLILATVSNLPVMFDELAAVVAGGGPQGKELLHHLVMMFTGGTDRTRAQQHGKGLQHVQGSWQTILLTASNMSIVDQLENHGKGTDAPGFRVVEFKARFPDRFDYAMGDQLKSELFENAGHAGAAYLQHLLRPEVLDYAKKDLDQTVAQIWKSTGWKAQHRFWVRLIASIYVAGNLVRGLGLLQVNPDDVVEWLIGELRWRTSPVTGEDENDEERETRTDHDAVAVLDQFCRDNLRNTLVVQNAFRPGDRPVEPYARPTGKLLVRHELQSGRLFVPAKDFRRFVIEEGYSFTDVMKALGEGGVLVNRKRMVTLGAGAVGLASAPTACMEFDMGHPVVSHIARLVQDPQRRNEDVNVT